MSTNTMDGRLEAVKRALEAARDVEHQCSGLSGEYRTRFEYHVRGMKAGLQTAIDTIDLELRVIAAGRAAAQQ